MGTPGHAAGRGSTKPVRAARVRQCGCRGGWTILGPTRPAADLLRIRLNERLAAPALATGLVARWDLGSTVSGGSDASLASFPRKTR